MEENFYLPKLLELKDNFSVKIIWGVRGVGKSALLNLFAQNLRAEGVPEAEIIFIDCAATEQLRNFNQLYSFVEERAADSERFFLLIDEADIVADCEKAINALFVGEPAEIYVTCSSFLFVEKISALLPDNCDVLKIYPLSFAEYVKYSAAEEALENYLHFGGLPATLDADKKILPKLLRGVAYELLFEAVAKNSVQRAEIFHLLMKRLAQNVGKPISSAQLSEGIDSSLETIKNYLHCGAGLFNKIQRFDIKNGKFLNGGEKFYCIDNGIISALAAVDESILIENAVYVELLRRGYKISSGKFGAMNITFVADEKIFIQVLPTSGISVRKATRPLRAMPDSKKILITLKHEKNFGDVKNITLREFLLGG